MVIVWGSGKAKRRLLILGDIIRAEYLVEILSLDIKNILFLDIFWFNGVSTLVAYLIPKYIQLDTLWILIEFWIKLRFNSLLIFNLVNKASISILFE